MAEPTAKSEKLKSIPVTLPAYTRRPLQGLEEKTGIGSGDLVQIALNLLRRRLDAGEVIDPKDKFFL